MTMRVRHSGHSRVPFMIKSEHARHKHRCLTHRAVSHRNGSKKASKAVTHPQSTITMLASSSWQITQRPVRSI